MASCEEVQVAFIRHHTHPKGGGQSMSPWKVLGPGGLRTPQRVPSPFSPPRRAPPTAEWHCPEAVQKWGWGRVQPPRNLLMRGPEKLREGEGLETEGARLPQSQGGRGPRT